MGLSLIEELFLAMSGKDVVKVKSMLELDIYTDDEREFLTKYCDLYCGYVAEASDFALENTLTSRSLDEVKEFRDRIFPHIWLNKEHLHSAVIIVRASGEKRQLKLQGKKE